LTSLVTWCERRTCATADAGRFDGLTAVVVGSTAGMMLANVPAVFLGHGAAHRLPLKLVRGAAAVIFAALGVATLLNIGGLWRAQ